MEPAVCYLVSEGVGALLRPEAERFAEGYMTEVPTQITVRGLEHTPAVLATLGADDRALAPGDRQTRHVGGLQAGEDEALLALRLVARLLAADLVEPDEAAEQQRHDQEQSGGAGIHGVSARGPCAAATTRAPP